MASSSPLDQLTLMRLISALIGALTASGLSKSNGDARRSIEQGAVSVNNVRQPADRPLTGADALHGRFVLLRRGKREQCLLAME